MLANFGGGDRKYVLGKEHPYAKQGSRAHSSRPGSGRRSGVLSRAVHTKRDGPVMKQPSYSNQQNYNAEPRRSENKAVTSSSAAMELDHAIGFAGHLSNSLFSHKDKMIYAAGGNVIIANPDDPHDQNFLTGGHENQITTIAVNTKADQIASGGEGQAPDVIVWDFPSGKIRYRLQEHEHGISVLAFSNDGRFLATCGNALDKKFFIWDMTTGMIVASTYFDPILMITWGGRVRDKKRRPTSSFLFAAISAVGKAQKVSLWALHPSTGKLESVACHCGSHVRMFTSVEFSTDGEWLYAGTTSGDIAIFQVKRSVLFSMVNVSGIVGIPTSITVPETSDYQLYVGGANGVVAHLSFDEKSFKSISRVKVDGGVSSLSLSEDKSQVLAGSTTGSITRIHTKSLKVQLVSQSHCASIKSISFSPESSEHFCTATNNGDIFVWNTNNYRISAKISEPRIRATCVVLSEDVMVAGFNDGVIRAYDPETGEKLWKIPNAHKDGVTTLVLSLNQKFIVSGGIRGEVRVWDVRTRQLVCHLKEHSTRVNKVCLYDSNKYVLSCSRDKSFLCWDLMSEKRLTAHSQPMGGINDMTLTPDQKTILTVGQERAVSLWNLRSAKPLRQWSHGGEATCVAVAKTAPLIATGGVSRLLMLWDLKTGKCLGKGIGHSATITDVAFSPDDQQVVSVGEDGSILVWNIFV
eukprot:jgi/Bigna1/89644/estExt_fgenesh1_pg.C_530022